MTSPSLPYTFVSCPCVDASRGATVNGEIQDAAGPIRSFDHDAQEDAAQHEGRTFDPRFPRLNYSLHPLEQLLYCEECQQIRCPRCVLEEIVCWFCPSCLFEVPGSMAKGEGNRCNRNCYNCPVCTSPLSVNALGPPSSDGAIGAPWVLLCPYCHWTTADVGITFTKPSNISGQLEDLRRKHGKGRSRLELVSGDAGFGTGGHVDAGVSSKSEEFTEEDLEKRFADLKAFYTSQLADDPSTVSSLDLRGGHGYGSPNALSRIMGLYGGLGGYGSKKPKAKAEPMREALSPDEGLKVISDQDPLIREMSDVGWDGTTSLTQRHGINSAARFPSYVITRHDCSVVPAGLTDTQSYSSHPDAPPHKALQTLSNMSPHPRQTRVQGANGSIQDASPRATVPWEVVTPALRPFTTTQCLLTFKNPLFDPISVTLATPTQTPGPMSCKTTILCPQFGVGANTDVWDEALGSATTATSNSDLRRKKEGSSGDGQERQAEAGKVWEKGRNWTSVVLEVVPGSQQSEADEEPGEDDDVLEIPVFVRVDWEVDAAMGSGTEAVSGDGEAAGAKDRKERRELAYWTVLGVGRVA
ncbi:MAG: hypothetical protein M1817_004755 [Caeruleum heppii]|nr:MAG: hypothetical protein M1817_004755 [Caeruleum heppii]